ncbi:MAG: hypothetical protein H7256_01315 [Bdellovibrio sp.]|nr:hypothetical protein [Bdellovibrio sp.]
MKKLILAFTFAMCSLSFAKELSLKEKADRSSLSIRLANYTAQKAKTLQGTVIDDIQTLSSIDLDEKMDLPLVQNAFLTLIILEDPVDGDPSRTGVQILAKSFSKNKSLYIKAANTLKTTKKKELKEILKVMESFSSEGNGQ